MQSTPSASITTRRDGVVLGLSILSIAGFFVPHSVIPAHAGIQYGKDRKGFAVVVRSGTLDSRVRGNDKEGQFRIPVQPCVSTYVERTEKQTEIGYSSSQHALLNFF